MFDRSNARTMQEALDSCRHVTCGWHVYMTVPTRACTARGIARAICRETGIPGYRTAKSVVEDVAGGWIEICTDGVALWCDGTQ